MDPVTVSAPLESVLKGTKNCSCGRKHKCALKLFQITDSGCELQLEALCRRLKARRLHLVSDTASMEAAGDRILQTIGGLGYTVTSSVLPEGETPVCDHEIAGALLLRIPDPCDLLVAVGDQPIADLVKFASLKNGVSAVIIPTSASTDSYAMPSALFLENGQRRHVKAAAPYAVLADLEVLCSAPVEKTNAGVAAVLADLISVADWKLSSLATGSFLCEETADIVLSHVENVMQTLGRGVSVRSQEAMTALITALVAAGAAVLLYGTETPLRGSEAAMADYLEHKLIAEGISDFSFDTLRGTCSVYALRMYDAVLRQKPAFAEAKGLFDSYGWVYLNNEIYRVFGASYAARILSRFTGDNFYDARNHESRIDRLDAAYESAIRPALSFLPSPSSVISLLRTVSFPVSMGALGLTRSETLDALVWSKENSPRYGILRLLADLGRLEETAQTLC